MTDRSSKRETSSPHAPSKDAERGEAPDAPPVEALDPNFQLQVLQRSGATFEGPLDLLLHLIRKHELDILDLPIAFVVERYLEYLTVMERLDLDIASEYLVMAATLAHIKSKMLLPPDPSDTDEEGEPGEEIDPRAELIRRLLEYQKYKDAAAQLLSRGVAGRDVFTRGMDAPEATGPAPLASIQLFKLLDAFQAVVARAKIDLSFEITTEGVSIQERMSFLTERMRGRARSTFDELFDDVRTSYDVVITFLAILEMAKRRLLRVYQVDIVGTIHLELLVREVDESSFEGVDDYEGGGGLSSAVGYVAPEDVDDVELDDAVARPGEDPLGEALDPDGGGSHDAPPQPAEGSEGPSPTPDVDDET